MVEERRREADEVVEKARVVFAKVMEMSKGWWER